jgi:small subunit ribosomal protein S4e
VYDAKGRFVVHRITKEEASYKLCKVRRLAFGKGGIPHIGTHDGRTIRYPDPEIKVNDTVMVDLESGKIRDFIKFDVGNLAMATGGHNNGRVGTIVHKEKHKGSFDIVHIKDAGAGRTRGRQQAAWGGAGCSLPPATLHRLYGCRCMMGNALSQSVMCV